MAEVIIITPFGQQSQYIPTEVSYKVTISNEFSDTIGVYDGMNNTGTLIGTILSNDVVTFNIKSGYVYIKSLTSVGSKTLKEVGEPYDPDILHNPYPITRDIDLEVYNANHSGGGGN